MSDQWTTLEYDINTTLSAYGKGSYAPNTTEAIDGFDYYDEVAYLQIYVPNIAGVDLLSNPIICMNIEDDDVLPGYYLDQNGNLNTINVDENMASSSLIWVISVNEVVDDSGLVDTTTYSSFKKPPTSQVLMRFGAVEISDKKEKRGNGRAEISFGGWNKTSGSCSANHLYTVTHVARISDAHLNDWCAVGKYIMTSANGWASDEQVSLLVWEDDKRVKYGKSAATYYASCPNLRINHASKESAYGALYPVRSWFNFDQTQYITYNDEDHGSLNNCDVKLFGFNDF